MDVGVDGQILFMCAFVAPGQAVWHSVCGSEQHAGQGLRDGTHTQALDALVLGRIDGTQPPEWLRPSLYREMH